MFKIWLNFNEALQSKIPHPWMLLHQILWSGKEQSEDCQEWVDKYNGPDKFDPWRSEQFASSDGGPDNLQVRMEVRTNSDGGPDKFDKKAGWRAHLYVESSP